MKLREINNSSELRKFVKFPMRLFKEASSYIPPLINEEVSTLAAHHNVDFKDARARYWVVESKGRIVGRIAGIIKPCDTDSSHMEARFGWLDFVNNLKVTSLLLSAVENWCLQENIYTLKGPLGFNSFDRSGILIEGYNEAPTMFGNYNYPYYSRLLEAVGYKSKFHWVEYRIQVPKEIPKKFIKGAQTIRKRYGLKQVAIKNKNALRGYSEAIRMLINEAYQGISGFSEISQEQFAQLYQKFVQLIPRDYFSLIEDNTGELVGFGLVMPDLSKALKKMNGRFFPFGYWQLHRALKKSDTVDLLLIAVKPSFQHRGVHALIFEQIIPAVIRRGVLYVESTKELESNSDVRNLWGDFDHRQHKKSACFYRDLRSNSSIENLLSYK
jgi:GNAT superfamily N-acetyltransferase